MIRMVIAWLFVLWVIAFGMWQTARPHWPDTIPEHQEHGLPLEQEIALLKVQEPAHRDDGHEDGALGHGCYSGERKQRGKAIKANCDSKCRVCEIDPQTGIPSSRETSKCKSYCHKNCCHCESPCDS